MVGESLTRQAVRRLRCPTPTYPATPQTRLRRSQNCEEETSGRLPPCSRGGLRFVFRGKTACIKQRERQILTQPPRPKSQLGSRARRRRMSSAAQLSRPVALSPSAFMSRCAGSSAAGRPPAPAAPFLIHTGG